MKKTLILMLLCGVASAEILVPSQCLILFSDVRTPKQNKICEELKKGCIDTLEKKRAKTDSKYENAEYQEYGAILNKVTAIDCNKKRK